MLRRGAQREYGSTHLESDSATTFAVGAVTTPLDKEHAAGGDLTDQGTLEIWPLVFERAFGQYMNTVNPYEMFKDNPYGQLAWPGYNHPQRLPFYQLQRQAMFTA